MPEQGIKNTQKADLHVHLNGAIPTILVKDLIRRFNCEIPEAFDCDSDLQVLSPVASLRDYFRPWFALKQLPIGKDCLCEMVLGAAASLREDGIVYAELRNSPFNIATLNEISLQETVEWLAEAASLAEARTGMDIRLILSLSRYMFDMSKGYELLDAVRRGNNGGAYIVGIDLSGDEDSPIPDDACVLFRKAKDELGLGVTIHAGETGNHANIHWAIQKCKADRIGHGLAAIKSQATLEMIIESDVCLEICLHSNLRTGQVGSIEEHPIARFADIGIPFVLCSDNPAVNGVKLSDDYRIFAELTGREDILNAMFARQNRYAFGRN